MAGAPDQVQIAFASSEGRCLVTCDLRYFIEHGRRAVRDRRPHAGIILCPASFAAEVGAIARALARVAAHYPDRKSTRLNSSHGYISYAVFCLKKKKHHN